MKKSSEPIHKHTLNLFEGDYEKIQNLYPNIGAGKIIRHIVRDFIKKLDDGSELKTQIGEIND